MWQTIDNLCRLKYYEVEKKTTQKMKKANLSKGRGAKPRV